MLNPVAAIIAFILGAAASLTASFVLVARLERVGERLGLSEALLGLLAAFAADAPEITAAMTAIAHRQQVVGAGVVLGSNVFNLAALLGLGALAAGRIRLHRKVVLLAGGVAIWVAFAALLTTSGALSTGAGLGFVLAVLVPYVVLLERHRRGVGSQRWATWLEVAVEEEELELAAVIRSSRGGALDAVVAALALAVVVVGSIAMERGASSLGTRYTVSEAVIGGLVLAAVTSLPNAIAAIYLARRGRGAAAFSTALNSNALNVLVGLLIAGLALGLAGPNAESLSMAAWYSGLTVVTIGLAYADEGLRRPAGLLIIACYGGFVASVLAHG